MKKNSKLEILPDNENSWTHSIENHPWILTAAENGKTILYTLLVIVLTATLAYRFFSASQKDDEAQFRLAENNFTKLKESSEGSQDVLKELYQVMDKHPELQAKYQGPIAQYLLTQGDFETASKLANLAINRTYAENDPFYTSYAKNTLLIADHKYDLALNHAKELQKNMQAQGNEFLNNPEKVSFGTLIYALNLFRIGMLSSELGLKDEELKTWNEWKTLSGQSREGKLPVYFDSMQFIALENLLSEGDSSFSNYIESREKVLK